MVRRGIINALEECKDMGVVGEAGDGKEALRVIAEVMPDVVILDVSMPVMNGIEATRRIKQDYPDIVVIGLSLHASQVMGETMCKAGASAYLTKDGPIDELTQTIGEVFQRKEI
ncbi:MAG: hypothetical protein COW13_04960 [Candidatus Omnitrophica bacterium CG12_big_fil_rev_8_21_14_0_65_50_5]|nr:MAG: hypothetical protein COW13_04960 [Candidatus Omnitrophica bacterium CG12_big_fil_rev_8_21_14_0_65_50_5]